MTMSANCSVPLFALEESKEEGFFCSEDELAIPENYYDNFLEDIQSHVLERIDFFFRGKEFHCGGPIPVELLHSACYVTQVLNTNIIDGVDAAYESLGFCNYVDGLGQEEKESFNKARSLVCRTLSLLSKTGVPKVYAGGILLMYLEIVHGIIMK